MLIWHTWRYEPIFLCLPWRAPFLLRSSLELLFRTRGHWSAFGDALVVPKPLTGRTMWRLPSSSPVASLLPTIFFWEGRELSYLRFSLMSAKDDDEMKCLWKYVPGLCKNLCKPHFPTGLVLFNIGKRQQNFAYLEQWRALKYRAGVGNINWKVVVYCGSMFTSSHLLPHKICLILQIKIWLFLRPTWLTEKWKSSSLFLLTVV